ncbi:MAG: hypothetical protein DMF06_05025 [Verrucomicrobia bacterium]|nr:MAG: hypothetical protein DMF06_05025 [Verrucomicrobiota bacterium]
MNEVVDIQAIRRTLQAHMDRAGLKGKTLSRMAGLNESAVRDIMVTVDNPGIATLLSLARALEVSPATLFGGTVPVAGLINGNGEILPIMQDGEPLQRVPRPPEAVGELLAYKVIGTGLMPAYRSGDVIYCTRNPGAIQDDFEGEECVVQLAGSGAILLRTLTFTAIKGVFNLHSFKTAELQNIPLAWAAPVLFVMRKRLNQRHLLPE